MFSDRHRLAHRPGLPHKCQRERRLRFRWWTKATTRPEHRAIRTQTDAMKTTRKPHGTCARCAMRRENHSRTRASGADWSPGSRSCEGKAPSRMARAGSSVRWRPRACRWRPRAGHGRPPPGRRTEKNVVVAKPKAVYAESARPLTQNLNRHDCPGRAEGTACIRASYFKPDTLSVQDQRDKHTCKTL